MIVAVPRSPTRSKSLLSTSTIATFPGGITRQIVVPGVAPWLPFFILHR